MSRARPQNGALAAVPAPYFAFTAGLAPSRQAASAVSAHLETVRSALSPWTAPQHYLNLAETGGDPARFWTAPAYERLRWIKAAVDPQDMIRANHPIPPQVAPSARRAAPAAK
jgi:hypothetical protein